MGVPRFLVFRDFLGILFSLSTVCQRFLQNLQDNDPKNMNVYSKGAYLKIPFSVKMTFVYCFIQLGLGVTIKKGQHFSSQWLDLRVGPPGPRQRKSADFLWCMRFPKCHLNRGRSDLMEGGFAKYQLPLNKIK